MSVSASASGCLGVWVSGCLGVWVSGCLGVRVSGCLGVWVSGCLGVWVTVPVCVCVQETESIKRFGVLWVRWNIHCFPKSEDPTK